MASKKKKNLVLRMAWGEEVKVTKETGKFYLCGERQFRKGSPHILEVTEAKGEKKEEVLNASEGGEADAAE
jgi:hypothetical protein